MNTIKEAIRIIGRQGGHITKPVIRYIYDEYEEDLFPYAYGDGSLESVTKAIWGLLDNIQAGKVDLRGTYEQRMSRRYESLKQEHLDLLAYVNRLKVAEYFEDNAGDGLPF